MLNILYQIKFYIKNFIGNPLDTNDFELKDNILFNAREDLFEIERNLISRFCDLYDIITKEDFIAKSKKKHFKKSEEYKILIELNDLLDNKYVKYFVKAKKSQLFKFYDNYTISFKEDFKYHEIDKTKWNISYYWGGKLLKDNYSLRHERHINNESNIKTGNGLIINIKKEDIVGKVWDVKKGFVMQKRCYSAATLNTAEKHSQKYGVIKVKAKLSSVKGLQNIICLQNIKNNKVISVVNSNKKGKISFGIYDKVKNKLKTHISKIFFDPTKDFYIYSLEWTPESIVWKINGITIRKISKNIPFQEMYLSINTSIRKNIDDSEFPKHLEIEWIKWYKYKN